MPAAFSHTGIVHNLAAIPVFFGLPAAAASYGWRSWRSGQPPGSAVSARALQLARSEHPDTRP